MPNCPRCSAPHKYTGFEAVDFACGTAMDYGKVIRVGPQCRLNEALAVGRRLISHAEGGVVPVEGVEKLVGVLEGAKQGA